MAIRTPYSTGIPGLDRVLCGLNPGDNLVWQVETMDDYAAFVKPFIDAAHKQGRPVTYFRFSRHAPVVPEGEGLNVVRLDPQAGFETFLGAIHAAVERNNGNAYHVFDLISDLAADWYSDQMVGNFFLLICPFLRRFDTLAYFAILRNHHSNYASVPVTETTQILLDVYRHQESLYIHPLKVDDRSSPGMYKLHVWETDGVRPVTESHVIADVLTGSERPALGLARRHLGVWSRTFLRAEEMFEDLRSGRISAEETRPMTRRLLRMAVSRHDRILRLAERYLDLSDLVYIGTRMLGTGLIGGKSVDMLLAQAILRKADPRWADLIETHDSFFIPSDVFYTYLVRNDCWAIRKRQLEAADYLEGSEEAYDRILNGQFPPHIEKRFAAMIDYFGQSPLVVRSSSLLEDSFGNSFAGKYDSVFCANQGPHAKRLNEFIDAVKRVYASAMHREALVYRARHGLLASDEQMALLVQRVSGAQYGRYHFPHIAGVGFSFNPYVWNENIDPDAGILRLVFGLGTRAVDRTDTDYTRLVALNDPMRRPEDTAEDLARRVQHKVDVIDLEQNERVTISFSEAAAQARNIPMPLFASRDLRLDRFAQERGLRRAAALRLTFDNLLSKTAFAEDMRAMLATLQEAFDYPVDIEFAANFDPDGRYRIALVQCRPLQVKGLNQPVDPPKDIPQGDILFAASGPVIGRSRFCPIDRLIYVVPAVYGNMPVKKRYAIARLIGQLNRLAKDNPGSPATALLGPGRWGSTTPSLGVPVSFAEINGVSVLCEIVAMRDDLVPDVSFGTHFFNDLVELDVLYCALQVEKPEILLNTGFFEGAPNALLRLLPDAAPWEDAVRVIDVREAVPGRSVRLWADTLRQRVLCYVA
jgi:pyruvate, water dikinase